MSNGRTSVTSVVPEDYKRRVGDVEPSFDHVGGQGTRSARLGTAALVDKFRQEPTSAAWRPTKQTTPMSADQAGEIARLRQENERLRI
ncbi:transposase [Bradyrhizobium sp. AZCC 1719]|uniref:hypothetical protein n=1 Tax=Bradyrhizobium sp. AZCC 1719 TaxID=3117028 RepID=UPI002FF3712B